MNDHGKPATGGRRASLARRAIIKAILGIGALPVSKYTLAQTSDYPTKPIRIIVPYAPGGVTDRNARLAAQFVGVRLGQSIVVENRGGANGLIGAQFVAQSAADGYTLLAGNSSTHGLNSGMYKKLPYDPLKDFTPVAGLTSDSFMLMAGPQSKVSTVKELVALAKQKPGELAMSSGTASTQVANEMFKAMAGLDMINVNFNSVPQAMQEVIAGRVVASFTDTASGVGFHKAGTLRALAVTGRNRANILPDVPTLVESGYPDYDLMGWNGLFAPVRTPAVAVAKFNSAMLEIMKEPEVKQLFTQNGAEVFTDSVERYTRFIDVEVPRWAALASKYASQIE